MLCILFIQYFSELSDQMLSNTANRIWPDLGLTDVEVKLIR